MYEIFSGTSGYQSRRKLLWVRTRRFPITCEKPFDDISNLWPVIWSSVFNYLKKSYLRSKSTKKQIFELFISHLATNESFSLSLFPAKKSKILLKNPFSGRVMSACNYIYGVNSISGQHPHPTRWSQKSLRQTRGRLRRFGCRQQNRNHLNSLAAFF